MAYRAAAPPTRVTVARIERAEKATARDWRPRSLLEPLFKREPFDLFAALTAHLVEPDPEQQASDDARRDAPSPLPPTTAGRQADAPLDLDHDEPPLARLALPDGFS